MERAREESMRSPVVGGMTAGPLLVPAIAVLACGAAIPAQERAGKARPVPGLTAPRALPPQLPRVHVADAGACFALAPRPDGATAVLTYALVLRQETFSSDPADPLEEISGARTKSLRSLVVGDFDADGADDVLGRDFGAPVLLAPGERPRPVPHPPTMMRDPEMGPWFSGRAHDWDGDGRADVLFLTDAKVRVMRGVLAKPTFATLIDLAGAFLPPGGPIAGTTADWDLDGMVDLVVSLPQRGVLWCRNEGTRAAPRFAQPSVVWPATPGVVVTSLLAFRVDDDPWDDLIVGTAAFGDDAEHRVVVRMPRVDRTPEQDEELRAALAERQQQQQGAALRAAVGNALGDARPVAFGWDDRLRAMKALDDRIAALQWTSVPMVAQAPYLQLRARQR
jgi:hypothetical protein